MIARSKRKSVVTITRTSAGVFAAFPTDLGWMAVEFAGGKLLRLTFGHNHQRAALSAIGATHAAAGLDAQRQRIIDLLTAFAAGQSDKLLDIDVDYGVITPFQRRVLDACRAIPPGETLSYAQVAQLAGAPGAARAVGNVMRSNKLPLVVPCHRVVGSGNCLGGYSAPEGLAMKRRLLQREGVALRG